MLSDAELARAAQSGNAASLGILLERHRAPLYALALRFLGHGPDAQDAVQDAFLTALRTIDRLREPEAVGGWLRGIVRNVCLRRLRERRQGEILFEEELPGRVESGFLESSVEEATPLGAFAREGGASRMVVFRSATPPERVSRAEAYRPKNSKPMPRPALQKP